MNALSPTLWYLIAAAAALAGAYATVRFFRAEQPEWLTMVIAIGCYGIAFGLVYALPAAPPAAVPITVNIVLAAIVAPKAARRIANWRRGRCGSVGGPPDIERIP